MQHFDNLQALLDFVSPIMPTTNKGTCELGMASEAIMRILSAPVNEQIIVCKLVVTGDAIRHSFREHGVEKQARELLRGQVAITEIDILALQVWLPAATQAQPGQVKPGKQPRIEVLTDDGATTAIMEWRPGRKHLALVTMYKKRPAV